MEDANTSRLTIIAVLSSVLFFVALTVLEAVPEIPIDIDFKPFFVPVAFVLLLPRGKPTVAVALGAALGEGLRDMLEGYEIDDPIGAVGYVVAFTAAGYAGGRIPTSRRSILVASLVAAVLQSIIEASAFAAFGESGWKTAAWSGAGNIVTHGIVVGALPLFWSMPRLHGRVERYLGFAPK